MKQAEKEKCCREIIPILLPNQASISYLNLFEGLPCFTNEFTSYHFIVGSQTLEMTRKLFSSQWNSKNIRNVEKNTLSFIISFINTYIYTYTNVHININILYTYAPSLRVSSVLKTAALFCITRCMSSLIFEVGKSPLAFRSLSNQPIVFSPALAGRSFCGSPVVTTELY